ncbi:POK6 protein, partial [Orthonyx spaldingii]|nr:POK6 protein [Orthonyx spaldingii]
VSHTTGIPHSPTGQAIVERAHQTLKKVLKQQAETEQSHSPVIRLARALFTINFLNGTAEDPDPPVLKHFANGGRNKLSENPMVLIKDPESQQ